MSANLFRGEKHGVNEIDHGGMRRTQITRPAVGHGVMSPDGDRFIQPDHPSDRGSPNPGGIDHHTSRDQILAGFHTCHFATGSVNANHLTQVNRLQFQNHLRQRKVPNGEHPPHLE